MDSIMYVLALISLCLLPLGASQWIEFTGPSVSGRISADTCGMDKMEQITLPGETTPRSCTDQCSRTYTGLQDSSPLTPTDQVLQFGLSQCAEGSEIQAPVTSDLSYTNPCSMKITTTNGQVLALDVKLEEGQSGTIVATDYIRLDMVDADANGDNLEVNFGTEYFRFTISTGVWINLVVQESPAGTFLLLTDGMLLGSVAPTIRSVSPDMTTVSLGVCATCSLSVVPTIKMEVKNVQMFEQAMSLRELGAISSGKLAALEPSTECLCPVSHPRAVAQEVVHLGYNISTVCDHPSDSTSTVPRLNRETNTDVYTPFYLFDNIYQTMTDSGIPLMWASKPAKEEAMLEIKFNKTIQMEKLVLHFINDAAVPSNAITLEKRLGDGDYEMWHVFVNPNGTTKCEDMAMGGKIVAADSVGCSLIEGGSLAWDVMKDRPGIRIAWSTDDRLKSFASADSMRITLQGLPDGSPPDTGVHALSEIELRSVSYQYSKASLSLETCDCYPGDGSLECDMNNVCQCTSTMQPNNRQCVPFVSSIMPTSGPIKGGTMMTIMGGNLLEQGDPTVKIADMECQIKTKSDQMITCEAPAGTSAGVDMQLMVTVDMGNGYIITAPETFVYRENPSVTSIEPLISIVSGGFNQTLEGFNFSPALMPSLNVSVQNKNTNEVIAKFYEMCMVHSDTMMTCPTPAMYIDKMNNDTNSPITMVNNEAVMFVIEVYMGGQPSVTMTTQPQLKVYPDPSVGDPEKVINFKTYQNSEITIKGKHFQIDGYENNFPMSVSIGKEMVEEFSGTDSQIKCKVPKDHTPEPLSGNGWWNNHPQLMIHQGNNAMLAGYVRYEKSVWDNTAIRIAILCLVFFVLLVLFVIFLIWKTNRAKKKDNKENLKMNIIQEQHQTHIVKEYQSPMKKTPLSHQKSNLYAMMDKGLQAELKPLLIPPDQLRILKEIKNGMFARIYGGLLTVPQGELSVMVKTARDNTMVTMAATEDVGGYIARTEDFLKQSTELVKFDHPNILKVLGIVFGNSHAQAYVVYGNADHGDLRTFLKDIHSTLSVSDLLLMGSHVGNAMAYLEERRHVHGDLAARNCMVDNGHMVRVGDAGLSQDLYPEEYGEVDGMSGLVPIRWTAQEVFHGEEISVNTDVWSFGILLWEIFTRGQRPYANMTDEQVINYVVNDNRLQKPAKCPEEMFTLMQHCWKARHSDRPTFHWMSDYLQNVVKPIIHKERGSFTVNNPNDYEEIVAPAPKEFVFTSGSTFPGVRASDSEYTYM